MPCELTPVQLSAYLDGELPLNEANAAETHISGCARCAGEIAVLLRNQRSLRAARGQYKPSAEFRRSIQRSIHKQTASRLRRWYLPSTIAILAAAVLVFAVIAYHRSSQSSEAFSEIADLHVNALASANPVDVISSDRHTVKPWFQGRIPFSFNLPEFAGTGYMLAGGRLVYFHQHPGAQLIVTEGQHQLSVLFFQRSWDLSQALPASNGASTRNAFTVENWQSSQLSTVVIGDTNPDTVARLAELIRRANP
jgi:anti-sigma factor RsiW